MGVPPKEASAVLASSTIPPALKSRPPIQSNAKSKLIADYIENFQRVTKGGLYIDGFAAPQKRDHEEAWTARRVLEIKPPRIRAFWLCDMEVTGIAQLEALKAKHDRHPRSRRVFVEKGDFNTSVKYILKSGRLTRRAAIFALLDQRTTECHWDTVRALAARAGRHKIELMYFFGTSWLHRSLGSRSTPGAIAEIERWWGRDDWRCLLDMTQIEATKCMADRFAAELSYKYVKFYPIFRDENASKQSFCLIHASDHPEAPKLMARSYKKIVGDIANTPTDSQRPLGL